MTYNVGYNYKEKNVVKHIVLACFEAYDKAWAYYRLLIDNPKTSKTYRSKLYVSY